MNEQNLGNANTNISSNVFDPLTGLKKYEYFVSDLKRIISENKNTPDFKLAIVYSDIRYFKYLNDTFGYNRGNELLKMYSEFISKPNPRFLGNCHVYSDNFISATNVSGLTEERFYAEIDKRNKNFEEIIKPFFFDRPIFLNTGVYILRDALNEDIETAISNANYARKESKKFNTDQCVQFSDQMMKDIIFRMELSASLPMAIETKEIKVFFQPKVDSVTNKVIGAEALARWIKKDGSMIYPDQFIPLLESNGMIVELDYYVYREVFKYIRERLDAGLEVVPISMNISRVHFKNDELGPYIEELLAQYKIPTEYIEFELTESIYIDRIHRILPFVNKMRGLGIKISMDDFGSGYSSLNLLNNLPIDVLKLDKVFLSNDDLSRNQKIILSCVISMAKQLNIKVLCEGVENKHQSEFLTTAGCDMFQGFYFSRPICEEDFNQYLKDNKIYDGK